MLPNKNLSYISNNNKYVLSYETLTDRLQYLANEDPDRDAFVYYSSSCIRSSITRKKFLDSCHNFAYHLNKFGIKKGDIIMIIMNNSIDQYVSHFGSLFSGAVLMHASLNLKDGSDLKMIIKTFNVKILIIETENEANFKIAMEINQSCKLLQCIVTDIHLNIARERCSELDALIKIPTEKCDLPLIEPEDIALYFSTSGSTGKPKLVACNHFYLLNQSLISTEDFGVDKDDIQFCDRPLPWMVGYPSMYLGLGVTRVIIDTRMTVFGSKTAAICNIIEKEKCTIVYLPIYIIHDLLENQHFSNSFKNVKTIYTAGCRISKKFVTPLKACFCQNFFVWYGSTEISNVCLFSHTDSESYDDGIIGKPTRGMEVKIVDSEGKIVHRNTIGELLVRTAIRFTCYKNEETKMSRCFTKEGWFHTGDLAHMRNDGSIIIDGRVSEKIFVGIIKYLPHEIEAPYLNHKDVKEAYAVNVPDSRFGEVACICIVPKCGSRLTIESLELYSSEVFINESIGAGQTPKPKHILMFDRIPLNENGKFSRRLLQEEAIRLLGISESCINSQ